MEGQTTQRPKEKGQKDKQRSTKHTYTTRVTQIPLKNGGELRCAGRVISSCSTSGTRRVNLITNPVISHERVKNWEVFMTSGTYPWSFVTQVFHSSQPGHGGDRKTLNVIIVLNISFGLSKQNFTGIRQRNLQI